MKKILSCLLLLALVCSLALVPAAREAVVFHDSNAVDTNDGLSPETPKKSLGSMSKHLVAMIPNGGTIVTVGKSYIGSDYTFPKTNGPVTFTSVYDGVDYKNPLPASNPACCFKMGGGKTFTIESALIFDDIILFQESAQNTVIVKDGGELTITESVVCLSKKPYYWNIVVEYGGKADIRGGIFSSITGDGEIKVADGVTVLDTGEEVADPIPTGDPKAVFHDSNGNDANDGLSPKTPKKSIGSLTSGLASLIPRGGRIVPVGKSYVARTWDFPETSGPVVYTSVWEGTDYKNPEPATNPNCAFKMASGATLTVKSDLVFDDVILFQENNQNTIHVTRGATLIVTDKAVLMTKPGNDYHFRIVIDEGALVILPKATQSVFTIENNGGTLADFTSLYWN